MRLVLINYRKDKIILKSRKIRGEEAYLVEASLNSDKPKLKRNVIHKKHKSCIKTECGLKFDRKEMAEFITNNCAVHWRKVTCKNCLKQRSQLNKKKTNKLK